MNTIFKKIFIIIFMLLICITQFNIKSFSADSLDGIISDGDDFIRSYSDDKIDLNKMKNLNNILYNILLSIGIIVAIIFATILGVQYMTAAAENKAQIKESMIPFIIGCIVVFGAFAIWKAILTVFI